MTKFVSNGTVVEDVENRESVMINSDIEKFMGLRESVENYNKTVDHWVNQTSKLLESNRNIEMNYDKLMMKVSDVDERISETTRMFATNKQELEDIQNARMISSQKHWEDCSSKMGKYADDFCHWIKKYSRDVLMKDIEKHNEECKKVGDDLATLQQELNDMKREHNSDYVEANKDIQDLSNLDSVIFGVRHSNNNLTHKVRSTEDSLSKIQKKIEQCKVAAKDVTKKNINMF